MPPKHAPLAYQTPRRRQTLRWQYAVALAGGVLATLVLVASAGVLFYGCAKRI